MMGFDERIQVSEAATFPASDPCPMRTKPLVPSKVPSRTPRQCRRESDAVDDQCRDECLRNSEGVAKSVIFLPRTALAMSNSDRAINQVEKSCADRDSKRFLGITRALR